MKLKPLPSRAKSIVSLIIPLPSFHGAMRHIRHFPRRRGRLIESCITMCEAFNLCYLTYVGSDKDTFLSSPSLHSSSFFPLPHPSFSASWAEQRAVAMIGSRNLMMLVGTPPSLKVRVQFRSNILLLLLPRESHSRLAAPFFAATLSAANPLIEVQ